MIWKLYPIAEFGSHHDQWQRLNLELAAPPLHDLDFISLSLQVFGSGKEILACYEVDNQAKAMAILTLRDTGVWETFQPSQAPLGAWVHSAGVHWPELLSDLIKKLPGFPLVLAVTQLDPDLIPRPEDSATIKALDHIETARVSVQGSFEDYWDRRSKKLRQNMRRQRRNLEKAGVTTRLQITTAPEEVAQAIADYGKLESAGWKGEQGTAIHPQNTQGKFYRDLLEQFCRKGAGRIYRYWFNDKIAAMNLCIEGNKSLVSLKIAYDESLSNGVSPAILMRQEVFNEVFNEGKIKKIEFYGRGQTIWTDEVRTLYHVNHYRFPLLPRLLTAMKMPLTAIRQRP
jgi:hypothetical protein